ncbi:hypothetical protein ACLMJK_002078 [Lecanora helva]
MESQYPRGQWPFINEPSTGLHSDSDGFSDKNIEKTMLSSDDKRVSSSGRGESRIENSSVVTAQKPPDLTFRKEDALNDQLDESGNVHTPLYPQPQRYHNKHMPATPQSLSAPGPSTERTVTTADKTERLQDCAPSKTHLERGWTTSRLRDQAKDTRAPKKSLIKVPHKSDSDALLVPSLKRSLSLPLRPKMGDSSGPRTKKIAIRPKHKLPSTTVSPTLMQPPDRAPDTGNEAKQPVPDNKTSSQTRTLRSKVQQQTLANPKATELLTPNKSKFELTDVVPKAYPPEGPCFSLDDVVPKQGPNPMEMSVCARNLHTFHSAYRACFPGLTVSPDVVQEPGVKERKFTLHNVTGTKPQEPLSHPQYGSAQYKVGDDDTAPVNPSDIDQGSNPLHPKACKTSQVGANGLNVKAVPDSHLVSTGGVDERIELTFEKHRYIVVREAEKHSAKDTISTKNKDTNMEDPGLGQSKEE